MERESFKEIGIYQFEKMFPGSVAGEVEPSKLERWFKHPDDHIRRHALFVLDKTHPDAEQWLKAFLDDADEGTRSRAIDYLRDNLGARVLDLLLPRLKDERPYVGSKILETIQKYPSLDLIPFVYDAWVDAQNKQWPNEFDSEDSIDPDELNRLFCDFEETLLCFERTALIAMLDLKLADSNLNTRIRALNILNRAQPERAGHLLIDWLNASSSVQDKKYLLLRTNWPTNWCLLDQLLKNYLEVTFADIDEGSRSKLRRKLDYFQWRHYNDWPIFNETMKKRMEPYAQNTGSIRTGSPSNKAASLGESCPDSLNPDFGNLDAHKRDMAYKQLKDPVVPDTLVLIHALLQDDDDEIRMDAFWALMRLEPDKAKLHAFAQSLLNSEDPKAKEAGLRALPDIDFPEWEKILFDARDSEFRNAACIKILRLAVSRNRPDWLERVSDWLRASDYDWKITGLRILEQAPFPVYEVLGSLWEFYDYIGFEEVYKTWSKSQWPLPSEALALLDTAVPAYAGEYVLKLILIHQEHLKNPAVHAQLSDYLPQALLADHYSDTLMSVLLAVHPHPDYQELAKVLPLLPADLRNLSRIQRRLFELYLRQGHPEALDLLSLHLTTAPIGRQELTWLREAPELAGGKILNLLKEVDDEDAMNLSWIVSILTKQEDEVQHQNLITLLPELSDTKLTAVLPILRARHENLAIPYLSSLSDLPRRTRAEVLLTLAHLGYDLLLPEITAFLTSGDLLLQQTAVKALTCLPPETSLSHLAPILISQAGLPATEVLTALRLHQRDAITPQWLSEGFCAYWRTHDADNSDNMHRFKAELCLLLSRPDDRRSWNFVINHESNLPHTPAGFRDYVLARLSLLIGPHMLIAELEHARPEVRQMMAMIYALYPAPHWLTVLNHRLEHESDPQVHKQILIRSARLFSPARRLERTAALSLLSAFSLTGLQFTRPMQLTRRAASVCQAQLTISERIEMLPHIIWRSLETKRISEALENLETLNRLLFMISPDFFWSEKYLLGQMLKHRLMSLLYVINNRAEEAEYQSLWSLWWADALHPTDLKAYDFSDLVSELRPAAARHDLKNWLTVPETHRQWYQAFFDGMGD